MVIPPLSSIYHLRHLAEMTADNDPKEAPVATPSPLDRQRLWEKYEDIAMHFNDLIIQLRSRSLVAVTAVATVVGVFADGANLSPVSGWTLATAVFVALCVVWIAIFCLDQLYYSRLLKGSVAAITRLEEAIENDQNTLISLSTQVEEEFSERKPPQLVSGIIAFYAIILFLLATCAICSAVVLLSLGDGDVIKIEEKKSISDVGTHAYSLSG